MENYFTELSKDFAEGRRLHVMQKWDSNYLRTEKTKLIIPNLSLCLDKSHGKFQTSPTYIP